LYCKSVNIMSELQLQRRKFQYMWHHNERVDILSDQQVIWKNQ
jgi:hypothetical protein